MGLLGFARSSAAMAAAAVLASAPAFANTMVGAAAGTFALTDFTTGLGGVTDFRWLPDGRMIIAEKTGGVRIRVSANEIVNALTLPVDTRSEKGLLGVEVDPAFATNGFVYLYWSRSDAAGGTDLNRHRVSRFTVAANSTIDPASELVLVENLRGPQNHDGGALAIGPDGKLYIGVGDTGCNSASPPGENISNWFGTCLTNGNGKILRVNLDGTIPEDNPLANEPAVTACGATCGQMPDPQTTGAPRTEIWAWGFRNPWRIWFDPQTGKLWVADVGEVTIEEVSLVEKGKHYGWPFREGAFGQDAGACAAMTPQSGPCVDPIYQCRHGAASGGVDGQCQSINGGMIVDHCTWPSPWRGQYFFGDTVTGAVWSLALNAERTAPADAGARAEFAQLSSGSPTAFRVGPDGALYVAVFGQTSGRILRIVPLLPAACDVPDGGADGGDGGAADAGQDAGGAGGTGGGGGPRPPPYEPYDSCACSGGAGSIGLLALLALVLALRRTRSA